MKKLILFVVAAILIPHIFIAAGSIDINTATLAQLDELEGIGPAYAQAIINDRPFSSVDDLLRVKGIGEKTLQKIKAQGLACVDCLPAAATPQALQAGQTQPPAPALYPTGIVINEMMPAPDGPDDTNEWVELYNTTSLVVDVSQWKLRDTEGTTATYVFPTGTSIAARNYLVVRRPETNIILNDERDGVELLWPNGTITDSITYDKAQRTQSYSNAESTWQWSTTPTPGSGNTITLSNAALLKPKKSANNNAVSAQTAAVVLPVQESLQTTAAPAMPSNAPMLFFAAGTVLLVCGGGVLGYYIIHHIRTKNHERSQSL